MRNASNGKYSSKLEDIGRRLIIVRYTEDYDLYYLELLRPCFRNLQFYVQHAAPRWPGEIGQRLRVFPFWHFCLCSVTPGALFLSNDLLSVLSLTLPLAYNFSLGCSNNALLKKQTWSALAGNAEFPRCCHDQRGIDTKSIVTSMHKRH